VAVFAVFAMLAAVSVLFSHDPAQSARSLPGLLLFLLVPIAIDTVRRPEAARRLLLALAAAGVVESLYSLWQYGAGRGVLADRIRGGLSHYMTFSGIAMVAGCLLLAWLLEERGRRRWVGALCLIPFAAIALTLTRGAYVGTLAALAMYLAVRRPRGLLLAVPLAALLIAASPREVRQRFVSIVDLQDETNRDRIAMARAGLRMIADRPIFGHGPEMIKPYYVLYRDEDAPRWRVPHLHDNVLQIAASMGIFTAAAYLAIVGLVLARTIVRLRAVPSRESGFLWAGPLMAVTALTFAGLFEYNFGDTEVLIATLIAMAVPFSRAVTPAPGG
jgi:O-antigen ligase